VRSPLHELMIQCKVDPKHLLITFTDASWIDNIDTRNSTGSFYIFYVGGIIDHSSNLPDPVALSFAESEHNEACSAHMETAHLCTMMLDELENHASKEVKTSSEPVPISIDNKSAEL